MLMNHIGTGAPVLPKVKKAYDTGGIPLLLHRAIKKVYSALFEMNNASWFVRELNTPLEKLAPKIPAEIDWYSRDETLEWIKGQQKSAYTAPQQLQENAVAIAQKHWFPVLANKIATIKLQTMAVLPLKIGKK